MALSLVKSAQHKNATGTAVRVLLLDTPENLGVDFLQSLQRQDMKLVFERVNDKEGLFKALKHGNWDILLVCDQVNVPGPEETLACLNQLNCETGYVLLSKSELSIEVLTSAYRKGIAAVVCAQQPEFSLEVFAREAERSRRNFQLSLLNQEKFELKRHCQQLMSGTQEALAYLQDGIHIFGNDAYLNLLGYADMDDLVVMPFIDIVSSEMRDKTKQRMLDFQHKVRMQPETADLEIPELFVNGTGEKDGVLQVAATFKPVVYEGEDCIQVVFKFDNTAEDREQTSAVEGLGYPLFVNHLDNFIAQAHAAGRHIGYVVHVRGTGFEHYFATRGFGNLNGKLKALTSELKASLDKDDLLIRFTENSFLILLKQIDSSKADGSSLLETLEALLKKFANTLNREIDSQDQDRLLTLSHEVIPVDEKSVSAGKLILGFLMDKSKATASEQQTVEHNVVRINETAEVVQQDNIPQLQPEQVVINTSEPEQQVNIDHHRLNAALTSNNLSLMYETVISVADIETEFHDIGLYLHSGKDSGADHVNRSTLGEAHNTGPLAAKLDQWALHNTLAVIADLYKQGQEYPVSLQLSARSLANKRLAEAVHNELNTFGLPGEMLVIDFSIDDINSDATTNYEQLGKLKAEGVILSVSDICDIRELQELLKHTRVDIICLQSNLIKDAASDETVFRQVQQSVESLHAMKVKIKAVDIHSNNELSVCCKVGIDLVKGKYIQKIPLVLNADSLAAELTV